MTERVGIWKQFPSVKSYLKNYEFGLDNWEVKDLPRLKQYVKLGSFVFNHTPDFEHQYDFYSAGEDLSRVAIALRWFAIKDSLSGVEDWEKKWDQSAAYAYWAERLRCRTQIRIFEDFNSGKRPQYISMAMFISTGFVIGNCLAAGWTDRAVDLTKRAIAVLEIDGFNDGGDWHHRRTQHFIIRLVADWQGWPSLAAPSCAFDEPLFNTLIEEWRTSDQKLLTELLLAACDRHTHQARPDSKKGNFDLPRADNTYVPFEILSILRLRELEGLKNPDPAALNHPLMNTPLGRLRPNVPVYTDELLEGVIARAKAEMPDI